MNLPIRPRPKATHRDRKLRLDRYIHLSLEPHTPLLADKLVRGYPHVLVEFVGDVANLPGAAFLRYNARAWRHREDFAPITAPDEKAEFLQAWCAGRFPSAELLIPDELPLQPFALTIHVATDQEEGWIQRLQVGLPLPPAPPLQRSPDLFPRQPTFDMAGCAEYAVGCLAAGKVLSPPDLPFD
jgi:hypothetical protein